MFDNNVSAMKIAPHLNTITAHDNTNRTATALQIEAF